MKKDYAKTRPPSVLNDFFLKMELSRKFSFDFEKGSTIIKLSDKEKAENLILKINTSISNTVENFKKSIKEDLSKSIKDFDENFINQITKDINPIINNIRSKLNKEGFTISLNIPNTSTLTLSESSPSIIENIIEIKQESVTKRRRQSGIFGTICKWVGTSDLGYESYQTTEDRFVINIEKIKAETINKIDGIFDGLDQSIFEKIEAPLQEGINNFFKELQTNVNQLKEHFEQGITYKQKSKEERDRIYENLIKNLRILESSEKDIKQLETEVKEFPQNFTQNL